jgi:hypothetical protein
MYERRYGDFESTWLYNNRIIVPIRGFQVGQNVSYTKVWFWEDLQGYSADHQQPSELTAAHDLYQHLEGH